MDSDRKKDLTETRGLHTRRTSVLRSWCKGRARGSLGFIYSVLPTRLSGKALLQLSTLSLYMIRNINFFSTWREVVSCFLWLWDLEWPRRERMFHLMTKQFIFGGKQTWNLVHWRHFFFFKSTNHLGSESWNKHHLRFLNRSFPTMYGCTLKARADTRLYFRTSF